MLFLLNVEQNIKASQIRIKAISSKNNQNGIKNLNNGINDTALKFVKQ